MNPLAKAGFSLSPETSLIPGHEGGIVFRPRPLRALRVNAPAFDLLRKCSNDQSLNDDGLDISVRLESTLSFFDRLYQAGLLEWKPPDGDFEPSVSIVVAAYNRSDEIGSCIESLMSLNYPRLKYEVIVVDDASEDDTCSVVSRYDVKLIRLDRNQGQSAARNAGVTEARGEIIAFIDSDCIAEPGWLRELVPYFQDSRNALVGGYVATYYRDSVLDRYEEVKSPLNMGRDTLIGTGEESDFYVPTCNMLVRRDVFLRAGGLNESLRVGEDVDFCWKLKEKGCRLVYAPYGTVRHKHRSRFSDAFKRRFDYGTSEPVLYSRHKAISKHYPWQPTCMAVFFLCGLGLLSGQPLTAPAGAACFLWDVFCKSRRYRKHIGIAVKFGTVLRASAVRHFDLAYHLTRHLIRYHLILMTLIAFMLPTTVPVFVAIVLLPVFTEFFKKKPSLSFPMFLVLFLTEQVSYQAGVFWGCLREKSFRPYRLVLTRGTRRRKPAFSTKLKQLGKVRNSPVISRWPS
ncbi:MAG: mycofactocin biosynthesis glycosyltransferase MftF [Desulfomonilaceae bacterium]